MRRYIKDRYGNKLKREQLKPNPSHWRIVSMLKKLRVSYRERGVGTSHFHMIVPDFGIVLKFNPLTPDDKFQGWDVVSVDLDQLEINDISFGENLMWLLISKGYMAYLRSNESGNRRLYDHFISTEGWGLKIINKRLELYANEPRHKFMIERNKRLRDMSIPYIKTHHPDFFDYLV